MKTRANASTATIVFAQSIAVSAAPITTLPYDVMSVMQPLAIQTKKLKEALKLLKDALVFECLEMDLTFSRTTKANHNLRLSAMGGENQAQVHEFWSLTTFKKQNKTSWSVCSPHLADRHHHLHEASPSKVVAHQHRFRPPQFVIARKVGRFWKMRDKITKDEPQQR